MTRPDQLRASEQILSPRPIATIKGSDDPILEGSHQPVKSKKKKSEKRENKGKTSKDDRNQKDKSRSFIL